MSESIGIVLIATNAYFPLGLRFVRKFHEFYKGSRSIRFYMFSDKNPAEYNLPSEIDIQWHETHHDHWQDGTNSKFKNILSIENQLFHFLPDYIYYFDADTNIHNPFTEDWFIGDLVGGQHWAYNDNPPPEKIPFERNPDSSCYIPLDTDRDMVYHYGAFFGGKKENVIEFCLSLITNQEKDKEINC